MISHEFMWQIFTEILVNIVYYCVMLYRRSEMGVYLVLQAYIA